MGKSRSISQQLIHAISVCGAIGQSKRSYKGQHGDTGYKIFSIGYRDDLKKTARDLGDYIRENHPDIRMSRNISADVLQGYLQHKAENGCTATYLSKLQSHLVKMDKCCSHAFGSTDWHTDRLQLPAVKDGATEKIRDKVATDTEYQKLLTIMQQPNRGEAWKAVILAREAGLRVQEAAEVKVGRLTQTGGRWGCGTITLQGKIDGTKGGRWRTVDILSKESAKALKTVFEGLKAGEHAIKQKNGLPVKSDSLNRALQRAVASDPKIAADWKKNNGMHVFRKAFAQECYDAARNTGCSKKEASDYANQQLGHGYDRTDLTAAYIQNQW